MSGKKINVIQHPLLEHKLSLMRDKKTQSVIFTRILSFLKHGLTKRLSFTIILFSPIKPEYSPSHFPANKDEGNMKSKTIMYRNCFIVTRVPNTSKMTRINTS